MNEESDVLQPPDDISTSKLSAIEPNDLNLILTESNRDPDPSISTIEPEPTPAEDSQSGDKTQQPPLPAPENPTIENDISIQDDLSGFNSLLSPILNAIVSPTEPPPIPPLPLREEPESTEAPANAEPAKKTRQSAVVRPKTAVGKHPTGSANLAAAASITQRSARPSAPDSFRQMILGQDPREARVQSIKKENTWATIQANKKQMDESPYTKEESEHMATDLLRGKQVHIINAAGIADVIDELTNIQLQAMQEGDYIQTEKIRVIVETLRYKYRTKDRDEFQKVCIAAKQERVDDIKRKLEEAKEQWRQNEEDFERNWDDRAKEMDARHDKELEDCEEKWRRDPHIASRFNKRSPQLLSRMRAEKCFLLVGNYSEADRLRRVNTRVEKAELEQRSFEYQSSFDTAVQRMLQTHADRVQNFQEQRTMQRKLFEKERNDALGVIQKALAQAERDLEDVKDRNKFVARNFKKGTDVVLPMTVTLNGGDDIPPAGKTRIVCGNNGNKDRFRQMNHYPPHQLPNLSAKNLKKRPRAYNSVLSARKKKPEI